jgi:hypothetical protein
LIAALSAYFSLQHWSFIMSKNTSKSRVVTRLTDSLFEMVPSDSHSPAIITLSDLADYAGIGMGWDNKKTFLEFKHVLPDVYHNLDQVDMFCIPVSQRILQTTAFQFECEGSLVEFSWRFVGWKTRPTRKADEKVKVGHLRMPDNKFGLAADRKDSSNHAEPKSVAIGDDAIYQMAKQCLPVSSWPTAAIAVHLPEYPSILIDAKINSRSKPIKTQVDNFVAMSDQYFGQKLTTITEPQKKIGL